MGLSLIDSFVKILFFFIKSKDCLLIFYNKNYIILMNIYGCIMEDCKVMCCFLLLFNMILMFKVGFI